MGQVWELRDPKPVPLQKAAQIGNFALVKPKVSLYSARRGSQSLSKFMIPIALLEKFEQLNIYYGH